MFKGKKGASKPFDSSSGERARSFTLRVFLFLLFFPRLLSADYNPDRIETEKAKMVLQEVAVSFLGNSYRVQIYTYPDHRAWGEELAQGVSRILPYLGNRFGTPKIAETVLIAEDPELLAPGWCSTEKGIRLRYPADLHDLTHELLHLWFNPKTISMPWLYEGIAGFEGILALLQTGYGDLAQLKIAQFVREALRDRNLRDYPLEGVPLHRETPERYRFGYVKSTLFVGLVRSALGKDGYEGWVTSLASYSKPITLEELKGQWLNLGRTPEPLLSGWVLPGAYQSYTFADLNDDDRDGIPNAYETIFGTRKEDPDSDRDGLSDGFEIFHRLNPLVRDTAGDGKSDLSRVGMAVDGLESDWSLRNLTPILEDREGDGTLGMDLTRVYGTSDGGSLYLRLDFKTPPSPGTPFTFEFLFDLDWDRSPDLVVVCNHELFCWYGAYRRNEPPPERGSFHPELRSALNRIFEIKIPLELFRGIPVFRMNLLFADGDGKNLYDHIGAYWQKIELQQIALR